MTANTVLNTVNENIWKILTGIIGSVSLWVLYTTMGLNTQYELLKAQNEQFRQEITVMKSSFLTKEVANQQFEKMQIQLDNISKGVDRVEKLIQHR